MSDGEGDRDPPEVAGGIRGQGLGRGSAGACHRGHRARHHRARKRDRQAPQDRGGDDRREAGRGEANRRRSRARARGRRGRGAAAAQRGRERADRPGALLAVPQQAARPHRRHRARERQADGEDRGHPHPPGRRPQRQRPWRQWRPQRHRRGDRLGAALPRPGAADRLASGGYRRRGRQPCQDAGPDPRGPRHAGHQGVRAQAAAVEAGGASRPRSLALRRGRAAGERSPRKKS